MLRDLSVANEVWARLVGLFGGKAVAARFGDSPPPEWVSVLGSLTQYQLERGMRRLVASGKPGVPSLPEFVRMCKSLQDDDLDESAQPALPPPDNWGGDPWGAAANLHLRAYLQANMPKNPRRYGRPASRALMVAREKDVLELGLDMKTLDASPQFVDNVAKLVAAKNSWAADMRDLARNNGGEVDVRMQKKIWDDYMQAAEKSVCTGNAKA